MEKICKYCGDVFTAKRSTAEYCSNSHRVMAFRGGSGIKGDVRLTEVAKKLFKYMAEKSATKDGLWELMKSFIPPILEFDTRPIDPRIFEISRDVQFYMPKGEGAEPNPNAKVKINRVESNNEIEEMVKSVMKGSKEWHEAVQIDEPEVDEMPMWKPNPKPAKVETKAETEKFAAAEMKRLKEMQERAEKLKGGKKK